MDVVQFANGVDDEDDGIEACNFWSVGVTFVYWAWYLVGPCGAMEGGGTFDSECCCAKLEFEGAVADG